MGADFCPLFLLKNSSEIFLRNIFFSQKLFCKFVGKEKPMKKLLVFFLFISNFIFSQNHIQTALEIDNYCNEIFNDKNLKETIVDGEIKDISYDINVGGFGVQIFKNDNEIKRILKEESLKNKYETLDCYFQNKNLIKVVVKEFINENRKLKNISTNHYYFFNGKVFKTFGNNLNPKMNKNIEDLLEYLK